MMNSMLRVRQIALACTAAWALVAWYEKLWTDPRFSLGGATGRLFVDDRGQVQHAPAWAEFAAAAGGCCFSSCCGAVGRLRD